MEDGTGRDNYLNKVAFIMGRYVGADLIAEEEVKAALREAALASGMLVQKVDEKLRRVVDDGKRKPITAEDLSPPEYEARPDGTYWRKPVKDGHVTVKLANFSARIVEDVKLDDGSGETQRVFALEGSLGRAQVPAKTYNNMQWVRDAWGLRANITPGQSHAQHLANAITTLSDDAREVTVYTHLGWREINKRWVYLHAGDGVGAEVRLDGPLASYALPRVTDIRAAVHASLEMLGVAPARVMYPLWGAVFRAPLGQFAPMTAALGLVGSSGVMKTTLALLAQAHYAPALGSRPAANWASTANFNERQAFLAKDALLLIDDFSPQGTQQDVARMHQSAERLIRGSANQAGRGRLTSDIRARPEWYPRCCLLITGEDVPRGHSLRARMLVAEVQIGDVNVEKLTAIQGRGEILSEAMSGYVAWLAGQGKAAFAQRQAALRAKVTGVGMRGHRRTSPSCSSASRRRCDSRSRWARSAGRRRMSTSGHLGTRCAALRRLRSCCWHLKSPAERFLGLVGAVLSSGRGHVAAVGGDAPWDRRRLNLAGGWLRATKKPRGSGASRAAASGGSRTTCSTSTRRSPTRRRSSSPRASTRR